MAKCPRFIDDWAAGTVQEFCTICDMKIRLHPPNAENVGASVSSVLPTTPALSSGIGAPRSEPQLPTTIPFQNSTEHEHAGSLPRSRKVVPPYQKSASDAKFGPSSGRSVSVTSEPKCVPVESIILVPAVFNSLSGDEISVLPKSLDQIQDCIYQHGMHIFVPPHLVELGGSFSKEQVYERVCTIMRECGGTWSQYFPMGGPGSLSFIKHGKAAAEGHNRSDSILSAWSVTSSSAAGSNAQFVRYYLQNQKPASTFSKVMILHLPQLVYNVDEKKLQPIAAFELQTGDSDIREEKKSSHFVHLAREV